MRLRPPTQVLQNKELKGGPPELLEWLKLCLAAQWFMHLSSFTTSHRYRYIHFTRQWRPHLMKALDPAPKP